MPILDSLVNTALNLGSVLAVLVALVVIHEFGHFVMARLAGVRVHEFGIGLPPRALTYHRGKETAYTLNWLPHRRLRAPGGRGRRLGRPAQLQPTSHCTVRTIILLAGVAMNFLLAWLIFSLIAGLADPTASIRINAFAPPTPSGQIGPAEAAGLTAGQGDRRHDADGPRLRRLGRRDPGHRRPAPSPGFDAGATGAPDAGIRYLREHAGQPVTLTVRHADGTVSGLSWSRSTTPEAAVDAGRPGYRQLRLRAAARDLQHDPLEAHPARLPANGAGVDARSSTRLGDLVGNLTNPQVAGPIGIVDIVGQVRTQAPPVFLVWLIGLLSANLAVINILPIPPMDGGRVLVGAHQAPRGRPPQREAERATYLVGFMLLIAFIVWISYFDIQRLRRVVTLGRADGGPARREPRPGADRGRRAAPPGRSAPYRHRATWAA